MRIGRRTMTTSLFAVVALLATLGTGSASASGSNQGTDVLATVTPIADGKWLFNTCQHNGGTSNTLLDYLTPISTSASTCTGYRRSATVSGTQRIQAGTSTITRQANGTFTTSFAASAPSTALDATTINVGWTYMGRTRTTYARTAETSYHSWCTPAAPWTAVQNSSGRVSYYTCSGLQESLDRKYTRRVTIRIKADNTRAYSKVAGPTGEWQYDTHRLRWRPR